MHTLTRSQLGIFSVKQIKWLKGFASIYVWHCQSFNTLTCSICFFDHSESWTVRIRIIGVVQLFYKIWFFFSIIFMKVCFKYDESNIKIWDVFFVFFFINRSSLLIKNIKVHIHKKRLEIQDHPSEAQTTHFLDLFQFLHQKMFVLHIMMNQI